MDASVLQGMDEQDRHVVMQVMEGRRCDSPRLVENEDGTRLMHVRVRDEDGSDKDFRLIAPLGYDSADGSNSNSRAVLEVTTSLNSMILDTHRFVATA